jgi:hypothetical protein
VEAGGEEGRIGYGTSSVPRRGAGVQEPYAVRLVPRTRYTTRHRRVGLERDCCPTALTVSSELQRLDGERLTYRNQYDLLPHLPPLVRCLVVYLVRGTNLTAYGSWTTSRPASNPLHSRKNVSADDTGTRGATSAEYFLKAGYAVSDTRLSIGRGRFCDGEKVEEGVERVGVVSREGS